MPPGTHPIHDPVRFRWPTGRIGHGSKLGAAHRMMAGSLATGGRPACAAPRPWRFRALEQGSVSQGNDFCRCPHRRLRRAHHPPPPRPRWESERQSGPLADRHGPQGVEPRTRAFGARRTAEGRSQRGIIHSLTRYVARELYRCLPRVPQPAGQTIGASDPRS